MQKLRELDKRDLLFANLKEQFGWIKEIRLYRDTVPGAKNYSFLFKCQLEKDDSRIRELESFVTEYFEVKKRRSRVIFCWRHTGLILLVFKQ